MTTFKRDFIFNEDILEVVANNVRKYRIERAVTQEQLAVDIGMSYDYLRRFETQKGREGLSLIKLYIVGIINS